MFFYSFVFSFLQIKRVLKLCRVMFFLRIEDPRCEQHFPFRKNVNRTRVQDLVIDIAHTSHKPILYESGHVKAKLVLHDEHLNRPTYKYIPCSFFLKEYSAHQHLACVYYNITNSHIFVNPYWANWRRSCHKDACPTVTHTMQMCNADVLQIKRYY